MTAAGLAWVDGETVDVEAARVPLLDRGYLLGDGVFETLRTVRGEPFRRRRHRRRFEDGLDALHVPSGGAGARFDRVVDELLAAGRQRFGGEVYLRINASTGPLRDIAGADGPLVFTGIARPFTGYPASHYGDGVRLIVASPVKHRDDPLSRVKHLSYLPYVLARREAHAAGAHDALLRNDAGRLAEASTSNLFALVDGTVRAPGADEGALPGVTRDVVLEILEEEGTPVAPALGEVHLDQADEAWLSNTTGGVWSVARVAGAAVGDGRPGPVAARLHRQLQERMEAEA